MKVIIRLEHGEVDLAELMQAEVDLHGDNRYLEVVDCVSKEIVGVHEKVGGRCLFLNWRPCPFSPWENQSAGQNKAPIVDGVHLALCDGMVSPTLPWVMPEIQEDNDDEDEPMLMADQPLVPSDLFALQDVYTEFALQGHDPVNPDIHPKFADGVGVVHDQSVPPIENSGDPVVALQKEQLCSLIRPAVSTYAVLESLVGQTIGTADRLKILDTQNELTSDDEIRWHVNRLLKLSGKEGWFQLDPLLLEEGIHRDIDCLLVEFIRACPVTPKAFVGAVRSKGHWVPFVWQWNSSSVSVWSWDVSANDSEINPIHKAIARALGIPTFIVKVELRNFSNANLCGICAIKFIDCLVRGKMLPTCVEDVKSLHAAGRELFLGEVVKHDFVSRPWTWGAGLEPKALKRLYDILEQHGVPTECIESRVDQAVKALGAHQIQQALLGSSPWKTLKALANNSRPPFQWVLPQELQEVLNRKVAQGNIAKSKKNGGHSDKRPTQRPQALDPMKLTLEIGAFVKEDATAVSQISFEQVGPFAEGIVIATMDQMEGHLKAGQYITQNALAAVVLNGGDAPVQTPLQWQQIRALVRCQANNEPLLVPAILVQLSQKPVVQAKLKACVEIPAVQAACCKISVYRDMVEGTWQQFTQGPVKYLFQHLPSFETCKDPSCGGGDSCPKWHKSPDQVIGEPVLDVWKRQWLTLSFKQSRPEDSSIFVVNFRYVQGLQARLMHCSGRMGIFVEPRSLDSKSPLLDFRVLWMKESIQELSRLAQVNPLVPVKTLDRDQGIVWLMQAVAEPPDSVLIYQGGQVIVTKVPTKTPNGSQQPAPDVIASSSTLGLCTLANEIEMKGKEDDPWAKTDPWSSYKPTVASDKVVPPVGMQEVQDRITKAVLARVQPMEVDDHSAKLNEYAAAADARFAALEQQVLQLHSGQQILEQQVDASSKKCDAQLHHIQQQFSAQIEAQGAQIQTLFGDQMRQIESLLSKKARTE